MSERNANPKNDCVVWLLRSLTIFWMSGYKSIERLNVDQT